MSLLQLTADFELVEDPNPPQDHRAEADGHGQGETSVRSGHAAPVDKVRREAGGEEASESFDTNADPSVQVVERAGSTAELVNALVRLKLE